MNADLKSIIRPLIPPSVVKYRLDRGHSSSVLFTFDDGPHPSVTPKVLDVLDKYDARALFFVVGRKARENPCVIEEIAKRNHGLGNHGFSHVPNTQMTCSEIVADITRCRDEIFRHAGVRTTIYRSSNGQVSLPTLYAAWRCRHSILKWSLTSEDVGGLKGAPPIELVKQVLTHLHARAVIVCHDDQAVSPKYLEMVLPLLIDKGIDLKSGLASLTPNSATAASLA